MPSAVESAVRDWATAGKPGQPAFAWPRAAWIEAFPEYAAVFEQLPDRLHRESVDQFARSQGDGAQDMVPLFLASMAWGFGRVGYGRYRVRKILDENPMIGSHLLSASRAMQEGSPLAGYQALASAHRVKHLGPVFGTKFLFFASRRSARALILDDVVSGWLAEKCDVRRNATRWSTKTYSGYLADMEHWAAACNVDPQTLEMVIFMNQVGWRRDSGMRIRVPPPGRRNARH